jgi:two-component system OmpR family response regulator
MSNGWLGGAGTLAGILLGFAIPAQEAMRARRAIHALLVERVRETANAFDARQIMEPPMRVLLVEDDWMIGEVVMDALKDASCAVDWVRDGQQALSAVKVHSYEAVLLDLGLPKVDGMSVLNAIRASNNAIPVLIITARDAVADRIRGLDGGADDYVLKPFEMTEVLARLRAIVRRRAGIAAPVLTNGIISLDPATHEAQSPEASLRLSAREFALLHALMIRPGAILSRTELEDRIYGWNEEVESNAVEFLIYSLRRKLGSDTIKNVRGVGWMVSKGG